MSWTLNLNAMTFEALVALDRLDKTHVGTPNYMGVAYFWGLNGTKHYLRDATAYQRRRVHKLWLEAGLDLTQDTEAHYSIITKVTGLQ
tara:strand:- start:335 stop:598 length:264 start_codon:yes stop_codon:yes gene_type:complete